MFATPELGPGAHGGRAEGSVPPGWPSESLKSGRTDRHHERQHKAKSRLRRTPPGPVATRRVGDGLYRGRHRKFLSAETSRSRGFGGQVQVQGRASSEGGREQKMWNVHSWCESRSVWLKSRINKIHRTLWQGVYRVFLRLLLLL